MTDGATLLALIEEANYQYDNIEEVIQAKIDECQKQIDELKAMSREQFLQMLSRSMFGVAMKEYYINRLEKRIERLKELPENIDNLLEYWRDNRFVFNESMKFYKPYVRQLKQAFQKLAGSKFNSKLSSFSTWVTDMENFAFTFYCHECKSHSKVELTKEPKQIVCENRHEMGIWSYEGTKEIKCKVCKGAIIGTYHIRVRHDMTTPTGKQIRVEGTKEEVEAVFNHMMAHPKVLKACIKAGLVKVE